MWTLLLILAAIALWYSPALRRSLARLIDPDRGPAPRRQDQARRQDQVSPEEPEDRA